MKYGDERKIGSLYVLVSHDGSVHLTDDSSLIPVINQLCQPVLLSCRHLIDSISHGNQLKIRSGLRKCLRFLLAKRQILSQAGLECEFEGKIEYIKQVINEIDSQLERESDVLALEQAHIALDLTRSLSRTYAFSFLFAPLVMLSALLAINLLPNPMPLNQLHVYIRFAIFVASLTLFFLLFALLTRKYVN